MLANFPNSNLSNLNAMQNMGRPGFGQGPPNALPYRPQQPVQPYQPQPIAPIGGSPMPGPVPVGPAPAPVSPYPVPPMQPIANPIQRQPYSLPPVAGLPMGGQMPMNNLQNLQALLAMHGARGF